MSWFARHFLGRWTIAAIQGDLAYELRLLSGLFRYSRWTTDINAALDIAARSKKVALKTKDPDDMALAETMLGAANHLAGNHLVALEAFRIRPEPLGVRLALPRGATLVSSHQPFARRHGAFSAVQRAARPITGLRKARHRGRRKIRSSGHVVPIPEPGSSGLFGAGGLSPVGAVHRAIERSLCGPLLEALPCRGDWPARSVAAPSK